MARFDIIGKRKIWYAISSLLIIASLFFMVTRGFNMGIDFTGGTIMDLRFEKAVNINDVRAVLNEYNLSNSTIQLSGESSSSTESENVMIRTVDLEEQERKEVMAGLTDKLGAYQVLREEKVGATMGTELIMNAIYATIISWLLIIAYVSYRFEFKFGISAVLGLAHNVIIVLGAFALTQRQIDSSFVAALLTIIGYSINDTIVIFDRIRENLKLHFRKKWRYCRTCKYKYLSDYDSLYLYSIYSIICYICALFIWWRYNKRFCLCFIDRFLLWCIYIYIHCQPTLGYI